MPVTHDALRLRIQPWLEPIVAEAPAGRLARLEPAYEQILQEVAKLESPSAGAVDWQKVVELGSELLKKTTKDLLLAAYLGYGFHATRGLEGLVDGTTLLSELMQLYWEPLFPEVARLKARANAVGWFIPRATSAVSAFKPTAADRATIEALDAALVRLTEVTRQKFAAASPGFGSLAESVARLKQSLPEVVAPAPAATVAAARPPAPVPVPTPPALAAGPGVPTDPAAVVDFLRQVGGSLTEVAALLRRTQPGDPQAYRVARWGLWLHLTQLPPVGPAGRTAIPPMNPTLRARLELQLSHSRWAELLDEAEGALTMNRFQLDLQRLAFQALHGMGHTAARDTLLAEVQGALLRFTGWPQLLASDGSPLADAATRAWLEQTVRPVQERGEAPPPRGGTEAEGTLEKARLSFREKRLTEAVGLLQDAAVTSRSGRERFLLQVELAEGLLRAGHALAARALLTALDDDGRGHGLEVWEPELAARCLSALLAATRLVKPPPGDQGDGPALFQRLMRLSPAAALKLEE